MSHASTLIALAAEPLLPRASSFAAEVDRSFLLGTWCAVFVVVFVAGALVIAALAPRVPAGADTPHPVRRRWLGQAGLLACVASLVVFFAHGSLVWADMLVVPRGAFPIRVAVADSGWTFTYPNGYVARELHVPLEQPVKLALSGFREPYSFAVPAFRLQVPVAAGADKSAWFEATLAGEWEARSWPRPALATSALAATVVVHPAGGFEKWYQDISGPPLDLPPVELGQRSFQMRGCTQCHSTDGSKLVGPSFAGFFTREHKLRGGGTVAPSEEYIRESLLDPQAKVVEGFEPVMPSFNGRLHELEIKGLAAYLASLK